MAISRMQNQQQLQGVGSLRQPYGLGKLVKKAVRGVKKIAKSPIGKAALLYAATAGLGSLGTSQTGFARFAPKNFMGNLGRIGGFLTGKGGAAKTGLGKWWGGLGTGKQIFTGLAGTALAAPFIQKALGYGPYEEEEGEEEDWTKMPSSMSSIVDRAQDYYRQPTNYADFQFMPEKQFVTPNFYAADGGRAGLLNGGEAGEAQLEQMLRAEYIKYKNKGGTMPYEQFKILVMKQAQQGQTPTQMMAADGGRIGYGLGSWVKSKLGLSKSGGSAQASPDRPVGDISDAELRSKALNIFKNKFSGMGFQTDDDDDVQYAAHGGRIGLQYGGHGGYDDDEDVLNQNRAMTMYRTRKQEGGMLKSKRGLVNEPGGYAGRKLGDILEHGWWHPSNKPTDEQLREWELERLERQKKALEEYVEPEVFTPEDIFTRDTPITEDLFGLSQGFTLSPITMLRRWLAEKELEKKTKKAQGGRIGKQEGGLMDLGGQEKDYREEGGFVPIGGEERADDVPARLSKNEFVFTADAVRNAGGGDIDRGSEVMQNIMENLEQGGEVSEDSQGLQGGEEIMSEEIIDESNPAQGMFDTYEQLQSRVA